MVLNKKTNNLIFLILILLVLSLTVGTFAYYSISNSGWGQNIITTSMSFSVNGQTILDEATSYDFGLLERGDSAEVVLEVKSEASLVSSAFIEYEIEFETIENIEANSELNLKKKKTDKNLAEAIEVYQLINGKYEFINMLSKMDSISNIILANSTDIVYLKFVYSKTASHYYEGHDFVLELNGSSTFYLDDKNLVMIGDEDTFKEELLSQSNKGKTLALATDIELTGDLVCDTPINIDLMGHTLKLTHSNLSFVDLNENVKIKNSAPNFGEILLDEKSSIQYNMNGAIVFIDDQIDSSLITIVDIGDNSQSLLEELKNQADKASGEIKVDGEKINITEGVSHYFTDYDYSLETNDTQLSDSLFYTVFDKGEIVTKTQNIDLKLKKNNVEIGVVDLDITVRGNSDDAIAQYFLDQIPDVVSSSLYFPSSDNLSHVKLNFVSSDDKLINNVGEFLPNGVDVLDDFSNKNVDITVIITNGNSHYKLSKEVKVELYTAEQRTNLIYNYEELLFTEFEEKFDIYNQNLNNQLKEKVGLIAIKILTDEENQAKFEDFFGETTKEGSGFQNFKVDDLPTVQPETIPIIIEFSYNDMGVTSSFKVKKTVTLVPPDHSGGLYDPTAKLQDYFSIGNSYLFGNDFQFYVSATTGSGVNVDYFVDEIDKNYLVIENDQYIKVEDGSDVGEVVLYNGEYHYRYEKLGFGYVISTTKDATYIYDGENYVNVSDNLSENVYNRKSLVTVLPNYVPEVESTEALITSKLWVEKDADGNKNYLKKEIEESLENGEIETTFIDREFVVTLPIEGIYHNKEESILDFNLYNKLKKIYDIDCDGWISYSEAQTEWENLPAENQAFLSMENGYTLINCDSLSINSLKGIEFFPYIQGISLSNNQLISIDSLLNLYNLKYLNLDNNLIASIDSLSFLDALEYLSLKNLPITSIEPLRYLPNIKNLSTNGSEKITDYEPISVFENLNFLDITGSHLSNSSETQYYLARAFSNNNQNAGFEIYNNGTDSQWTAGFSAEQLEMIVVGSEVISQMLIATEAHLTLNVPNSYSLNGENYNIKWVADAGQNYLLFINNSMGQTTGYEINSPIVDKNIGITVYISKADGTEIAVSKKVEMSLLRAQNQSSIPYIELPSGELKKASNVVLDKNLLSILFSIFNSNTSETITGIDENGNNITVSDKYTLTQDEIAGGGIGNASLLIEDYKTMFRNQSIKTLDGIEYFTRLTGLDLRENELENADISKLANLYDLKELYLTGQKYDFSLLSTYAENASGEKTITGLTNLDTLYVTGCFELDKMEVLTNLYGVYLANSNVEIYLAGDPGTHSANTAWNPYEKALENALSRLPKVYELGYEAQGVGENIKIVGKSVNVYGNEGEEQFVVNPYGIKDVAFSFTSFKASDDIRNNYLNVIEQNNKIVSLSSKSFAGMTFADQILFNVEGNDGRSSIATKHIAGLKFMFLDNVYIVNVNGVNGQEFDSEYLSYSSKTYVEGNATYQALSFDQIFSNFSLRKEVIRQVATKINSGYVNENGVLSNTNYAHYDRENNNFYLKLSALQTATVNLKSFSFDGVYDENIADNQFKGLKVLTSLKSITFEGGANFGDGSELIHATSLSSSNNANTYVTFSTITKDLPNMNIINLSNGNVLTELYSYRDSENNLAVPTKLSDGTFAYSEDASIYYNMKHFTGLEQLFLQNNRISDWEGLKGFYSSNLEGGNSLYKLSIYQSSDASKTNTNTTLSSTLAIIDTIYKESNATVEKDFRIRSYNEKEFTGIDSLDYDIAHSAEEDFKDLSKYINDLGVLADNTLYMENTKQELSDGSTLKLPLDTSKQFFGVNDIELLSGANITDEERANWNELQRKYAIEWYVVGLDSDTANEVFGVSNASHFVNDSYNCAKIESGEFTLNSQNHDTYFVLTGVIGGGYLDVDNNLVEMTGQTKKYFSYPILLKGTENTNGSSTVYYDGGSDEIGGDEFYTTTAHGNTATYLSYEAFSDLEMRLAMFMLMSIQPENLISEGEFAKAGTMLYSVENQNQTIRAGVTAVTGLEYLLENNTVEFKLTSANVEGETVVAFISNDEIIKMILGQNSDLVFKSINGLENFVSLQNLSLNNMYITSIEKLQPLAEWSNRSVFINSSRKIDKTLGITISLENNEITDLSPLSNFFNLSTLKFGDNDISTLRKADNSFILSNTNALKELKLDGNFCISKEDVLALSNTTLGNFQKINLNNTKSEYDYDTLSYLVEISKKSVSADGTNRRLNVTINGDTDVDFRPSRLNNFDSDIAENISYAIGGKTPFQTSSGNYTFELLEEKALLFDANFESDLAGGSLPQGFEMTMRVGTARGVLKFDVPIKIYDRASNVGSAISLTGFNNVVFNSNDFSSALWLSLVQPVDRTKPNGEKILERKITKIIFNPELSSTVLDGTTLKIASKEIDSLKGIDKLTHLTEIELYNLKSVDEFGADLPLNQVTKLVVEDCLSIDEKILSDMIENLPSLVTLDLYNQNHINYLLPAYGTTLGALIGDTENDIVNFYCDSTYQFNVYNEVDMMESMLEYLNKNNTLFNIVGAKKLSAFSNLDCLSQSRNGKTVLPCEMFKPVVAKISLFETSYKNSIRNFNVSANIVDINTGLRLALLVQRSNFKRELLPDSFIVSQNNPINIRLPQTIYIYGEEFDIDWTSIKINNDANTENRYLVDDFLSIQSIEDLLEADINNKVQFKITVKTGKKTFAIWKSIAIFADEKVESNTNNAPFYLEQNDGTMVNALNAFSGTDLIYKMFANGGSALYNENAKISPIKMTGSDGALGSYFSVEQIESVNTLVIENVSSISSPRSSEFNGISIFENVKNLKINNANGGNVNVLSPIKGLALETFEHNPSKKMMYMTDFSPLINSSNTLKTFNSKYITQFKVRDDLSFLKMFTNIENIHLETDSLPNYINGFEDKLVNHSLQYVADYFITNTDVNFEIEIDQKQQDNSLANRYKYTLENSILSNLKIYDGSYGVSLDVVSFKNAMWKVDLTHTLDEIADYTIKLPAYIESHGDYYEIYYKEYSKDFSMGDTIYRGDAFTVEIDGVQTTYVDNTIVEEGDLDKIFSTLEGKSVLLNKKGEFFKQMTISDFSLTKKIAEPIEVGIIAKDYHYSRYITLYDQNAWSDIA